MKFIFCCARGLSAPGRKKRIDDTTIPHNPACVGFQETKKESFSNSFLKNLLGNRTFDTGGILVGIDLYVLNIVSWKFSQFFVSVVLRDKSANIISRIITVHGFFYEEGKQEFISELHKLFLYWDDPAIVQFH